MSSGRRLEAGGLSMFILSFKKLEIVEDGNSGGNVAIFFNLAVLFSAIRCKQNHQIPPIQPNDITSSISPVTL